MDITRKTGGDFSGLKRGKLLTSILDHAVFFSFSFSFSFYFSLFFSCEKVQLAGFFFLNYHLAEWLNW
jgi:hypothetical protein